MALIPKNLEKPIFYGAAILGGLFVLKIMTSSVKDATAGIVGGVIEGAFDATAGVIEGAFDATAGVLQGAYNAVPDAVKPSSENNIVYQGVNSIGGAISGNKSWDLGGWIYDVTH